MTFAEYQSLKDTYNDSFTYGLDFSFPAQSYKDISKQDAEVSIKELIIADLKENNSDYCKFIT